MSFATNLTSVGRRLIQAYGESITLQRVVEGAYDVSDGSVAAGTTTNYTAKGHPSEYNNNEIDDTSIRKADIKLWLEKPTTQVPTVGDTATLNSETYRVIDVQNLRAQGVDVVYILQCRI